VSDATALFDCALRTLALRDHSEAELRRKLAARKFDPVDVEGAIERLKELRYLDDRRFARAFAESAMRNGRGYGVKLSMELSRRGVSGAIVAEVLAELTEEFQEKEALAQLLERKFPSFDAASATDKEKRRVVGFLQRRGFTLSAIFAQLRVSRDD